VGDRLFTAARTEPRSRARATRTLISGALVLLAIVLPARPAFATPSVGLSVPAVDGDNVTEPEVREAGGGPGFR